MNVILLNLQYLLRKVVRGMLIYILKIYLLKKDDVINVSGLLHLSGTCFVPLWLFSWKPCPQKYICFYFSRTILNFIFSEKNLGVFQEIDWILQFDWCRGLVCVEDVHSYRVFLLNWYSFNPWRSLNRGVISETISKQNESNASLYSKFELGRGRKILNQ